MTTLGNTDANEMKRLEKHINARILNLLFCSQRHMLPVDDKP